MNVQNESRRKTVSQIVDGRRVTITFSEQNPKLSFLVRNTLLDAYLRNRGISATKSD